jgi:hypothetical protein
MIMAMSEFTDEHRQILDFERTLWKYAGAKESAIRQTFGYGSVRYYQLLAWAINQPEALAHAPMTVRRLQRLRDRRMAERRTSRIYGRAG